MISRTPSTSRAWLLAAACLLLPAQQALAQEPLRLTADRTEVFAGEPVTFTLTAEIELAERGVEYLINFGDGEPRRPEVARDFLRTQSVSVVHRYTQPGRYRATAQLLQNEDPFAESRPVDVVVTQREEPATAELRVSSRDVAAGTPITFEIESILLARANEYRFSFGDQNVTPPAGMVSSKRPEITHVYRQPGTYRASAQLVRNGQPIAQTPTVTVEVRVAPEPVEVVLRANPTTLTAGETVRFEVDVQGALPFDGEIFPVYRFQFSDRPAEERAEPALTRPYTVSDNYEAWVEVVFGEEVIAVSPRVQIAVAPNEAAVPPPPLTLRADPPRAREGEQVVFTVGGGPDVPGAMYRLHFGDGPPTDWLPTRTFTHVYTAPDDYSAQVEMQVQPNAAPVSSNFIPIVIESIPPETRTPPPLWLLIVGVLLLLAAGGFFLFRRKPPSRTQPPPTKPRETPVVPPSELVFRPRSDPGSAQLAPGRPLAIQTEIRLRPVSDAGRHTLVIADDALIEETRYHGTPST